MIAAWLVPIAVFAATAISMHPSTVSARECAKAAAHALSDRTYAFPRDDGAHDDYATEWWRTFGRVRDVAGNPYDVSLNVSRFAVDPCASSTPSNAWTAKRIVTSTFEMIDERTGRVVRSTHVEREGSLGARVSKGRLGFTIADVRFADVSSARATLRSYALDVASGADSAANLVTSPLRAATALGPGGRMQTGSCATCQAYAYAYPSLRARGSIELDGSTHIVDGTFSMEHEFAARELDAGDVGWDRFDVMLENGDFFDERFIRGSAGIVAVAGARISHAGRVRYVTQDDASEQNYPPNTHWQSVTSGVTYPSSWLVDGIEIDEVANDQESYVDARMPFYMGAIDAGDLGHGFVELTGYDRPLAL